MSLVEGVSIDRGKVLYDREEDLDADEEDDVDQDDEVSTSPCPYCGAPIYEDAQRCPQCGEYISEEDRPAARRPWWIIIGAVACLYAVYRWTAG